MFRFLDSLRARLHNSIYDRLKPANVISKKIHGNIMYIDPSDKGLAPNLLIEGKMENFETELFTLLCARIALKVPLFFKIFS